eukprot:349873-Chlamydomonas_euryale.AAC.2
MVVTPVMGAGCDAVGSHACRGGGLASITFSPSLPPSITFCPSLLPFVPAFQVRHVNLPPHLSPPLLPPFTEASAATPVSPPLLPPFTEASLNPMKPHVACPHMTRLHVVQTWRGGAPSARRMRWCGRSGGVDAHKVNRSCRRATFLHPCVDPLGRGVTTSRRTSGCEVWNTNCKDSKGKLIGGHMPRRIQQSGTEAGDSSVCQHVFVCSHSCRAQGCTLQSRWPVSAGVFCFKAPQVQGPRSKVQGPRSNLQGPRSKVQV